MAHIFSVTLRRGSKCGWNSATSCVTKAPPGPDTIAWLCEELIFFFLSYSFLKGIEGGVQRACF